MSICRRCTEKIDTEAATCGDCLACFHFGCSIPEITYRKLHKTKQSWRCFECSGGAKTRSRAYSDGQFDGGKIEGMFASITKQLSSLDMLQKEMKDVVSSVTFMSEKYDELIAEVKQQRSEISELKNTLNSMKSAEKEKDKIIKELRDEIDELQQYTRNRNVEISGMPTSPNEDCKKVVGMLSKELEIDVTESDIDIAHRLPNKNHSIIVQFKTREKRDLLVAKRCLTIHNNHIPDTSIGQKIYINEHLTAANKQLLRLAKKRAREMGYEYVWVKNGKIMVRKASQDQAIRIQREDDLVNKMSK